MNVSKSKKQEIKEFITKYRKLSETQKVGFQLMLEGARVMNEQKKRRYK